MKITIQAIIYIFYYSICYGQVSLKKIGLTNGEFKVGFSHYLTFDSTRTYNRIYDWNNKKIPRPIPVSIWYPATHIAPNDTLLEILNYMKVLKEEEEWEHLPDEQILNWFYYQNNDENRKHLKEKTTAYPNALPLPKEFPVIVYAPSFQASSVENFALCEFLASHGYVIISSPSRGTENRFFEGGTEKDMETQARDIEFLIKEIQKFKNVNEDQIATMAFSFGSLSNVLAQMRNNNIKAIVSLDGSIKYNYPVLQQSPFHSIEKVNVPFIHMAQKNIPDEVLDKDIVDPKLNTEFPFYDSLLFSKAYSLKFNHLTHSYFSTMGVLFQERDMRQDKSDAEIMKAYKLMAIYTLNFLDAFLKEDDKAYEFLEKRPEENNISGGILTKKLKSPVKKLFSFEDFNEMALKNNYKDLYNLYKSSLKVDPTLKLEEWKLNNLGLQLVFNPQKSEQGINIFLLATKIYPESSNLFDSLAEAYLFVGNKELAISNFEKSLLLNPENQKCN